MSLIAWWPLNGDTYNKGTLGNELNPTVSNMTYVENGKIGKAKHTGTLTLTADQMTKWIDNTISIAMWIYIRNDGTWKNGTPFFSQASTMTAPNNRKFSMFCYDGSTDGSAKTSLHCSWQHDDSNSTYYSCVHKNFFTIGQWTHLCIVQNAQNNKIDLYKNGNLITSTTVTGLNTFNITKANNTPLLTDLDYLQINDLRIYDHALSKAEIQELKKTLVIHYTFNDILAESTTNIMPINYQKGQFITGASDNNYDSAGSFTVNTTTHGTYTLSGYYKIGTTDTATNPRISLNARYNENSNAITICQFRPIVRDDEWHYFSLTGITDSTKTLQSLSGWFFDYSSPGNGRICYAKDIQLELKDHATPYTASNRPEMLCNEVGLSQHNNIQNINLSLDAAVGKYALNCNNTCINLPSTGDIVNGATASFWVKVDTYPASNQVVFADYNSKLAFGFYGTQNAIISCGSHSVGIISNIQARWKQNAWNHIAIIRTTTNQFICYLNNEQLALSSSTNNWTTLADCTIGCRNNGTYNTYFNGLIDDFRLYYTQLSPEEIKDLYKCGGRISNLGDALTGEFIEDTTTTKVNRNHTIETKEIYEQILPDGYQQLEYIQSNGSQYINTGVIPTNQTEIQYDHQYVGGSSGWYALFGMDNHSTNAGMGFTVFIVNDEYRPYMGADWGKNTNAYTSRERELLILNQQGLSINGNKIYNQFAAGTHTALGDVKLFAYWRPANGTGSGSAVRLYKCKFLENKQTIRDFIPARRISDNALGLYDIINNQFYINAGSGEFIAGPTLTTGQASMLRTGGLTAREIIEI